MQCFVFLSDLHYLFFIFMFLFSNLDNFFLEKEGKRKRRVLLFLSIQLKKI